MKKYLSLLLTLCLLATMTVLFMVSCNGGGGSPDTTTDKHYAPTEAPTGSSSEEPTEEVVSTDETEYITEPTTAWDETVEDDESDKEPEEAPPSVIAPVSPAHGDTVCVANARVSEYYTNYTIGSGTKYCHNGDIYMPLPITLKWEDVGADCYRVRLATASDFSDSKVVLTAATTVSFSNPLVATTYYWQVEALYEDRTDASAVFSFKTAPMPRAVHIEGVSNTRDIGGYAVSETARIRQGMVYRSGILNAITEKGLYQAKEELGIRCEVDYTGSAAGSHVSSLGNDVLYYNFEGVHYLMLADEAYQKILAEEIRIFADPSNYPMLIHCALGRDRTGTAAMMLLALCGVSEKDVYCDYELSMFSEQGSLGEPETMVAQHVRPTFDYIKSVCKKDTLQENVEAFLLKIGVTAEEIASIKSIMIEEVQ